jgi:F-type H+-transporting ATPase subunit b
MESIIETFHIDMKMMLAQAFNFAIVFAVVYYFALRPLAKIMGERTKKIEKSLEDAKNIDEKLQQTKQDYEVMIANAKKEANEILAKASANAEIQRKETIAKAKEEIGQTINKEKAQMQIEKANTLKEIKKEVADLVVLSLEKVLAEKIDIKKDKEIIKKIIQ